MPDDVIPLIPSARQAPICIECDAPMRYYRASNLCPDCVENRRLMKRRGCLCGGEMDEDDGYCERCGREGEDWVR